MKLSVIIFALLLIWFCLEFSGLWSPVRNLYNKWKIQSEKRRKRYMKIQKRWANWLKANPEPEPLRSPTRRL